MTLYVIGGVPLTVDVPLGTYEIRYAAGQAWCNVTELFGPQTVYNKADRRFEFDRGVEWTIELGSKLINSFGLTIRS